MLHIEHLADRSPFNLSGGQQRLVAIAGVIACRPRVLIMDEPTASLDESAVSRIHALLGSLKSQGVAVLIITHSIDEAEHCADRIITMGSHKRRRRRWRWLRHPETTETPASATHRVFHERQQSRHRVRRRRIQEPSVIRSVPGSAREDGDVPDVDVHRIRHHQAGAAGDGRRPDRMRRGGRPAASAAFAVFRARVPDRIRGDGPGEHVLRPLRRDACAHIGPLPITTGGLMVAVLYSCRLALVIILGAVFLATTTPTAMTDAFGSLLLPFKLGWHTQEVALVMSLALRFLPTLSDETKAIIDAQSARGGTSETGSPATRVKALFAIIVPILVAALRHADNLSLALDARCPTGRHPPHPLSNARAPTRSNGRSHVRRLRRRAAGGGTAPD